MTWECPECGFDNDDERDMCEECGALRPAGVAPAPSTPAAPVQDFAAPSGERPAPAVYPATSSMGGTPPVQQSASQQVYQSVPVPAPQPAPHGHVDAAAYPHARSATRSGCRANAAARAATHGECCSYSCGSCAYACRSSYG